MIVTTEVRAGPELLLTSCTLSTHPSFSASFWPTHPAAQAVRKPVTPSNISAHLQADQGPTVEQGLAAVSDRDTLAWVPTTAPDDSRSAFTATWRCALPASTKGLRRGLTIRAYVEVRQGARNG